MWIENSHLKLKVDGFKMLEVTDKALLKLMECMEKGNKR